MSSFFVQIYDYLSVRKWLRNILLVGSFLLMLFFALQLKFEEEFTRFFPDNENSANSELVFKNLKVKDKIIVMISARDSLQSHNLLDTLVSAGDNLVQQIKQSEANDYILNIFAEAGGETISQTSDFIYNYLPIFLTNADYARMDSLLTPEAIDSRMQQNFVYLMSPAGVALKSSIPKDPLGLAGNVMLKLKDFENLSNYEIYNNRIFSTDFGTMLVILSPKFGTGETGKNEVLISKLERIAKNTETTYNDVQVQFFGGPTVAVYNARQVKKDTYLTLGIALFVILLFMWTMFQSRRAIPLLLTPVVYGGVFSLAAIFFIKGSISAIAIGVGAVVLGIALSYSIHVITHYNHVKSRRQLVQELAYPLVVGGFTTIGAFLSLLFTTSDMLRDFGLFSALTLIGTTFFCLVFLPHLLGKKKHTENSGRALALVEKVAAYQFEKNKVLLGIIGVLFLVGLFTMKNVQFDSDMSNLNFEPPAIKQAEKKMSQLFLTGDKQQIMFVSVGQTENEASQSYRENNSTFRQLLQEKRINGFVSAESFAVQQAEQQKRIRKWDNFWTSEKVQKLKADMAQSTQKYGFSADAFLPFFQLIEQQVSPFSVKQLGENIPFLADWITENEEIAMYITQVQLSDAQKKDVYQTLAENPNLVIFDRGFFTNQWVSAIHIDFNTILYLSSIIIFLALLVSYGRIELTLMAFAPMAISWVIILGIMSLVGIEFNIINIILSTFIFGLGDDFSIFMMDGLQQEYRTGKKLIQSHKIAILFSAFTATVGMGVLIFAKHPALQSISVISIVGMISVLLVSYTVIPILFRTFLTNPTRKGNYPYTLVYFLATTLFYVLFVLGSLLLFLFRIILLLIPVSGKRKKQYFSIVTMHVLRFFLRMGFHTKKEIINPHGETFMKPAVIVANHQSMIDILIMLSLAPRIIMVTNKWVWNSPVFGHVVRYAGFVPAHLGFDKMRAILQEKISEGYSVVIFPEGTRSVSDKIKRFHKGAFLLAETLNLDIVPVALYGTGQLLHKRQMYYIKPGTYAASTLPRISANDAPIIGNAQQLAKHTATIVRAELDRLTDIYSRPNNLYFRHKLIANYLYKGPVEEWYVRVKSAMEKYYQFFESIIPRQATVVDVGCGYGMLAYMLTNTSKKRTVLGIDYDQDKVDVANHNFSKTDRIQFVCADALTYNLPQADVFVLNDMLHYMDYDSQNELLNRCLQNLQDQGMIIVRDSDAEKVEKQKITRFTEILSTKIFKFNKTEQKLQFPTAKQFHLFAQANDLEIQRKMNDKYTSNQIFIFTKKSR